MTSTLAESRTNIEAIIGENAEAPKAVAPPIVIQYWNIARRRVWLIAAILLASLVLGVVLTLLATPQYTAKSRIEISRLQANVTNVEGLQREEPGQDLEFYQTQYSLLSARSLAERVAKRMRLSRDDAFFEAHDTTAGESATAGQAGLLSAQELQERQRKAEDLLLEHVGISPVRGSALVDVTYTSASPQLSARIADAWVKEFIQQSMDRRFASTADARVFLENRLEGLRQRLEQSERELVNYAAREGIVRLSEVRSEDGRTQPTQTLASSDVAALNAALQDAIAERVSAEGQLRAAERSRSNSATIQNPAINQLRQRRAEAEAQYAELLVKFDPQYPAARALRQNIDSLNSAIAGEERRVTGSFYAAFDAASQREGELRQRVNSLLGRLESENRASIQFNIYQREVDTNRQLYDSLLQRYKEIGVAGVGTNNIATVDTAIVPDKPSSPRLVLNLLLATVAGLAAAGALVFVLENVDESLREPQQLQDELGIPLLGAIPMVAEEEGIDQISDPKSILAEAYMTVRTNLAFSTDHGVPRTLSLTSSGPAEGKSTSSFAIAQVLGRTGKSVVLVDVDMRRPRMAEMLGLDGQLGVSNYLSGDDDWAQMIQQTDKPNLSFMAAGPVPPSASELLSGDRLAKLTNELSTRFDHVILDGPPMLGLSDAALIARCVEGTIYIIESNRTSIRAAQASLARLIGSRAHIIGGVLTKYMSKQSGYGYGYGYGYQYGEDKRSDGMQGRHNG